MNDVVTRLEHLPNELLLQIFVATNLRDLANGFWNLNLRLNLLIRSLRSLSFVLNGRKAFEGEISVLFPQIVRLVVVTYDALPLAPFVNLRSLSLNWVRPALFQQIDATTLPLLEFFSSPTEFLPAEIQPIAEKIFSNSFVHLHHVELGLIRSSTTFSWTLCPTLRSMRLIVGDLKIIEEILFHSPNLTHLAVRLKLIERLRLASTPLFHPLKSFQLIEFDRTEITADLRQLFFRIPLVEVLDLRCSIVGAFGFLQNIAKIFSHLRRFHCHLIEEQPDEEENLDRLCSLHRTFRPIERTLRDDQSRLFSTFPPF